MVDRERLKSGQGSDLCLALTTSFSGDENEITRLRFVFGGDFSIRKTWFEGMGWFKWGMSRWRWVGEDEDEGWVGEEEGWVGGGWGQGMGWRSGLHATAGRVSRGGSRHHRRGWVWTRMGLIDEDVLGIFRWSVLELSLFRCVFSGNSFKVK